MLSSNDLERLIAEKRHEIEREKIDLGLSRSLDNNVEENKEKYNSKKVQISEKVLENNYVNPDDEFQKERRSSLEEDIPADLERYIRRCTGLPVMLKAGEYSPNNPLVRGERPGPGGDVMLGLGEYERRRNTLRRIRQQQYREYLDQQAKLKQEAKEKAERERREREEKERAREEERERERRDIEIPSPVGRRASLNYGYDVSSGSNNTYITKVDTGVQVESTARPLSVAVQTDDVGLYPVQVDQKLTQAERELSPRVAGEQAHKWTEDWTHWKERRRSYGDFDEPTSGVRKSNKEKLIGDLRHSYMPSIFDADAIQLRNLQAEKEALARRQSHQQELRNQILEQQRIREERKNREKLLEQAEMRRLEQQLSALRSARALHAHRHTQHDQYMKEHTSEYEKKRALLQSEIEKEKRTLLRSTSHKPVTNVSRDMTQTSHSEKTDKLPFYYQNKPPYSINIPENSIFSQNYDIDSYLRKNLNPSRESLISSNVRELRAENVNTIKPVKNNENTKDNYTENKIRDNYTDYKNAKVNYTENKTRDNYTDTKNSRDNYTDNKNAKVNYTENKTRDNYTDNKNSKGNYRDYENAKDNYPENKTRDNYTDNKISIGNYTDNKNTKVNYTESKSARENYTDNKNNNIIIEKALIHTQPKRSKEDTLPIPVLKHSPIKSNDINQNTELSKQMQIVDDKWKIPAVQKNILKTLPKEDGKNINILTQLGSIRRQLQLEQLKLDMIGKEDA